VVGKLGDERGEEEHAACGRVVNKVYLLAWRLCITFKLLASQHRSRAAARCVCTNESRIPWTLIQIRAFEVARFCNLLVSFLLGRPPGSRIEADVVEGSDVVLEGPDVVEQPDVLKEPRQAHSNNKGNDDQAESRDGEMSISASRTKADPIGTTSA